MAHFCAGIRSDLAVDMAYVAEAGSATAFIWGGDGSGNPLEMLSLDETVRIPSAEPKLTPGSHIASYPLLRTHVGKSFVGVVAGTNRRYTANELRVVDLAAHKIDFMGKGRIFIIGDDLALCKRVETLLSAWMWSSVVGQALLQEIFACHCRAIIQIGKFKFDPRTAGFSPLDGLMAGAPFGTGKGSDAWSRFNDNLGLLDSTCHRISSGGDCTRIAWDRPEFNLVHELTHANRYMRGKIVPEIGDPRFGKLEEELVCLINNMYLSEKGAPLRSDYFTTASMPYDPSRYFVEFHGTARQLLMLLRNEHSILFAATNTPASPVHFNPVYAWFKGSTTIPAGDPGSP